MATRTISNTGGNYNSTATWVEGAVPTSADDVVATATSGQLTVNVASAARTFDFTNYTNTLTMNNTWTVSGASLTNTFVSAMSIAGSSNIVMSGNAQVLVTNGLTIPNLNFSAGNKTLNDDLNVGNLSVQNLTLSGTRTINISGNFLTGNLVNLVGANITVNMIGTGNLTGGALALLRININTTGTITLSDSQGIGFQTSAASPNMALQYTQGTIAGNRRIRVSYQANNTTFTADLGSTTWTDFNAQIATGAASDVANLVLTSDLNVTNFNIWGNTVGKILRISGAGRIIATSLSALSWTYNSTGNILRNTPTLQLASSATHSTQILTLSGYDENTRLLVSSQTASTTGYLASTGTQSVQLVTFTDIDATGGPISVWRGSLTRTNAITNYTSFGGGVSGGSFTFVN